MKKILFALVMALSAILINAAPDTIGSQVIGGPIKLSVTADGTQPFTYQWSKNGTAIPGATSVDYVIAAVSQADAGTYTVTVKNSAGSVLSNNAIFTVTLVTPTNAIITFTKG